MTNTQEVIFGIIKLIFWFYVIMATLALIINIQLNPNSWQCVASNIINGKAECVVYQMKKKEP